MGRLGYVRLGLKLVSLVEFDFDKRSIGPNRIFRPAKTKTPFGVAIGNWELMHECFPKHSRMGTARMK